jgi:Flp pilus assembly protein TadD
MQVRQNLALVLGLSGNLAEAEKLLRQDLPPAQAEANLAWLQSQQAKPGAAPLTRSWDSLKATGS